MRADAEVVPGGFARHPLRWLPYAALAAILAVAGALRYTGLESLSLWYDEGWSYYVAALRPADALRALVQYADPHPPGYYLLLIAWCRAFGVSTLTLRALSATLGVLEVGAMFLLGREVASSGAPNGRAATCSGLLAAALLAVAPADIMYSHEGRMYTLLGLCAILLLSLYYRYGSRRASWRPHLWVALVLCEAVALYTHFFAVFLVGGLAVWLLVRLCFEARAGRPRALWHWLISQGAVILLYLPWLPVTLQRAAGHTTGTTYVPPLGRFLADVWSFLLSGQTDLLAPNPLYAALAWSALALFTAATIPAALHRSTRPALAFLLLQYVLPTGGVYLLTLARPGFHPRYLLMILYPLLAALAVVLMTLWSRTASRGRRWIGRALAITLLGLWLAATATGYRLARATAPWRDDARSLVADLGQDMPADSGVLAAYTGWELRPYLANTGLEGSYVNTLRPQAQLETELAAWLEGRPQAAYVRWGQSDTDHAGVIAYLLAQRGRLIDARTYPGYEVSLFAVDTQPALTERRDAGLSFGPVELTSYTLPSTTPADGALAVALQWRWRNTTSQDLKLSVTLWDSAGHLYSQTDRALLDIRGRGTARWSEAADVTDYVTLPLGRGLAPGEYTLKISVYSEAEPSSIEAVDASGAPAGRRATLGSVVIAPPRAGPPVSAVPPLASRLGLAPLAAPAELAPGLALTAARLERSEIASGERLGVILEWQRTSFATVPALWPELQLIRGDQVLVRVAPPAGWDRNQPSLWVPGERYVDWRDLVIPPELAGGPATLQLTLPGEAPVVLGQIEVTAVSRALQMPPVQHRLSGTEGWSLREVASLAGFDLYAGESALDAGRALTAGDEVDATLIWRALGPSGVPLVAFVHLVSADGRLIAQSDSEPAGGARTTTGWLAGEYITDAHPLSWLDLAYRGEARLHVGLYDPVSGQRLAATSGQDHLLLPLTLKVEP